MNTDNLSFPQFPSRESLTIEFKSDPKSGLPDKVVVETVVGLANAEGGTLYVGIMMTVSCRVYEHPDGATRTLPPLTLLRTPFHL